MERILIMGCSGSGKTTLAGLLSTRLSLPVLHLDELRQTPEGLLLSPEALEARLDACLARGRWILEGRLDRTLESRLPCCDAVFYLDYSRFTCFHSLARRTLLHPGRSIQSVLHFHREERARILRLLQSVRAEVHVFHSRMACERYLVRLDTRSIHSWA